MSFPHYCSHVVLHDCKEQKGWESDVEDCTMHFSIKNYISETNLLNDVGMTVPKGIGTRHNIHIYVGKRSNDGMMA